MFNLSLFVSPKMVVGILNVFTSLDYLFIKSVLVFSFYCGEPCLSCFVTHFFTCFSLKVFQQIGILSFHFEFEQITQHSDDNTFQNVKSDLKMRRHE